VELMHMRHKLDKDTRLVTLRFDLLQEVLDLH